MAKYRVTIFIIITFGILITTIILIQLGKGYRPNISNGTLTSTGLLSADSDPKGAQVYINGELTTATDDTINLEPGMYQVQIKKDGFLPWSKNIKIEKELVAQTNATLFPRVPDLKALTYTGAHNPVLSPNGTKIIYSVTPNTPSEASESTNSAQETVTEATLSSPIYNDLDEENIGLWLLELSDLPLGFSRDPQQVIIGEPNTGTWKDAELIWSPDSREVLAAFYTNQEVATTEATRKLPTRAYRVQLNQPVNANTLSNVASQYQQIIEDWEQDTQDKLNRQLSALPEELSGLFATTSANIRFSPDETKILYTATNSAELASNYIPPVLATNNQPQTRTLVPGGRYVYDTKEDLNFQIDILETSEDNQDTTYSWFPTSQHLIKSEINQITILEYDNTNHATVYSSSLPIQVFSHPSSTKLIVQTTLNPLNSPITNLYTLLLR